MGIAQQPLGLRPTVSVTQPSTATAVPTSVSKESKVLDKRRLQELVKEVDPLEQLDEDVEEVCITIIQTFTSDYLQYVDLYCLVTKYHVEIFLRKEDITLSS